MLPRPDLLFVLRPTFVHLPALQDVSLVLCAWQVLLNLESSRMFLNPRLGCVLNLLRLPNLAMFPNAEGMGALLLHAKSMAYR